MAEYRRTELYQANPVSRAQSESAAADADYFNRVSQVAGNFASKFGAVAGQQQGQETGMNATREIEVTNPDGTTETKQVAAHDSSPFAAFTSYGQAYNAAADAAYAARTEIDFMDTASGLLEAYPQDVNGFDEASAAFEEEYFSDMDASAQQIAVQGWERYKGQARGKIASAQAKAAMQENMYSTLELAQRHEKQSQDLARDGDLEAAQESLEQAIAIARGMGQFGVSAKEIFKTVHDLKVGFEKSALHGEIERMAGEGRFEEASDMLRNVDFVELDDAERKTAISQGRTIINEYKARFAEQEAEQNKAFDMERALFASNLEIGVSRGQVGYDAIDKAYADEMITAAKRTQLYLKRDGLLKGKLDAAEDVASVVRVMLDPDSRRMDREDNATKKAVETYFGETFKDLNIMDMGEGTDRFVHMVDKLGVIPKSAMSNLRRSMRDGPAESAIPAAKVILNIKATDKTLADAFQQDDIAEAEMIAAKLDAGMPEENVIQAVRTIRQMPDAQKEVLQKNFKDKVASQIPSQLEDFIDNDPQAGWFSFEPDAPIQMQSEFKQLAKTYYTMTGDEEIAFKLAAEGLERKGWGITEVNGERQLSPYAPEIVYGQDSETLREDFRQSVVDMGLNADRMVLLPGDDETARGGGYPIAEVREDGVIVPNLEKRWVFDRQRAAEQRMKELQANVEKARQKRATKKPGLIDRYGAVMTRGRANASD